MIEINEYLKILGYEVEDVVSGMKGIVVSVSFDLYGCVQCVVALPYNEKEGKVPDSNWADHKRLKVISKKPVMKVPVFSSRKTLGDENGGNVLPPLPKGPR